MCIINFELRKGEVHALLGENGAGKSTLIKSIAGAHQCDSGTITIDGKEFHGLTPLQAKEMGVEVVYQEFNQMPSLSVAENIYLTELRGKRIVADQREFERKAAELFKEMNLDLNPKVKVASLTNGYKQMVEIAKAISKPDHQNSDSRRADGASDRRPGRHSVPADPQSEGEGDLDDLHLPPYAGNL